MSEHTIILGPQRFQLEQCFACAIQYLIPYGFYQTRKNGTAEDHLIFYCPNGHSQQYTESEVDRLSQQLKDANLYLGNCRAELNKRDAEVQRLKKRKGAK